MRALLALSIFCILTGCHVRSANELVAIAAELGEAGQLDSAMLYVNEALAKEPDHLWALMQRGVIQHDKGDVQQAIASYEEVLKRDPENVVAFYNSSIAWLDLEDPQQAFDQLKKLMAIKVPSWSENSPGPYLYFQRVNNPWLGLEEPEFDVHYNKIAYQFAVVYLRLDSSHKALGWLDHCISTGYMLEEALVERGILYHRHGLHSEACEDLERAVLLRDKDAIKVWRQLCKGNN